MEDTRYYLYGNSIFVILQRAIWILKGSMWIGKVLAALAVLRNDQYLLILLELILPFLMFIVVNVGTIQVVQRHDGIIIDVQKILVLYGRPFVIWLEGSCVHYHSHWMITDSIVHMIILKIGFQMPSRTFLSSLWVVIFLPTEQQGLLDQPIAPQQDGTQSK
jgi:hypothetical protein